MQPGRADRGSGVPYGAVGALGDVRPEECEARRGEQQLAARRLLTQKLGEAFGACRRPRLAGTASTGGLGTERILAARARLPERRFSPRSSCTYAIVTPATDQEDHLESWDIASLDLQPHHPQVLRSDEHTRAIAINFTRGRNVAGARDPRGGLPDRERGPGRARAGRGDRGRRHGVCGAFSAPRAARGARQGDSRLLLILAPWPGVGHPSAA